MSPFPPPPRSLIEQLFHTPPPPPPWLWEGTGMREQIRRLRAITEPASGQDEECQLLEGRNRELARELEATKTTLRWAQNDLAMWKRRAERWKVLAATYRMALKKAADMPVRWNYKQLLRIAYVVRPPWFQ